MKHFTFNEHILEYHQVYSSIKTIAAQGQGRHYEDQGLRCISSFLIKLAITRY